MTSTSTDVKNDIKTLFFIINSISALLPGILMFSGGVAFAIEPASPGEFKDPVSPIVLVVFGLIMLAIGALGYAGAFRQNRIMLFIYTGLMVLSVLFEIVRAASAVAADLRLVDGMTAIIAHICLLALGGIVSLVLALKTRRQSNQGMILSPPTAAYTPAAYTPVA